MTTKLTDNINVHTIKNMRLKALWALDQLTRKDSDRFSISKVSKYLIDKHGINTSPQAISYGLKRNNGAYHKNIRGYKLMELGRDELSKLLDLEDVIIIEPGKPYTAKNIKLKSIFDSLKGTIYITDPYVDIGTLDVIFKNVPENISVRILTGEIIEKPNGSFSRHLSELKKEKIAIEVRLYSNSELHDRYLMDNDSIWLSGNSLNHLGNKESFIVKLGSDIYSTMIETFNRRWKMSRKA
jgi:DNA-binding transcriptional ArsR family regulator